MRADPIIARIVALRGGDITGAYTANVPGSGHSSRDRSLSVMVSAGAPDGFLLFSHAGDDVLYEKDMLRQALGLPGWERSGEPCERRLHARARREGEIQAYRVRKLALAKQTWEEGEPPTKLVPYFEGRGLCLTDDVLAAGALRFHRACPVRIGEETHRYPAMLAVMTDPLTGEFAGLHRTFLSRDLRRKAELPDGKKAKRWLGGGRGAVIRLVPFDESGVLALAEGIENAMAGMALGSPPAWAAASAGNMQLLPVLPNIERLVVLADRGETGERAADTVARRWAAEGRDAEILLPKHGDWNDVLRGAANDHA